MDRTFRVREYQPADKNSVLALKKAVDGEPFAEALWQWKFESGSVRPAQTFVVDNEKEVVGLRTFIIERLKVMDRVLIAGLGVEVMVHPDFRRFRIASLMASEGFELMQQKDVPVLLGFPNEVAYKVYSKTRPHWGPVCVIPLLVKPLNFENIISHYVHNRFLKPVAKTIARGAWKLISPERISRESETNIEEVQGFDPRFDTLWEEACRTYDIGLVRDKAFLEWRFSKPQAQYSLFVATRNGKLCGYMVLKNDEMFNLRLGLILDLLTLPGDSSAGALVGHAVAHFREQKMDAVGCLMLRHSPYCKTLHQAGFMAIPNKVSPKRFYFGVQVKPDVVSSAVIYNPRRWFLTFADIDVA